MGKNSNLKLMARFIALGVSHKVGQIMNPNSIFAEKYNKEARNFIEQADNIKLRENWNSKDKDNIRKEVKIEAIKELNRKAHLDKSKFDVLDEVIDNCLKELNLN